MGDYTLTLEEVSKRLNKSKKTISRYIKNGLLHPEETLSEKNTLVYKFSEADLELFKSGQGRQDKKPREDKTGHKQKTSRVNKLNRGQTRQDNEETRGDNDRTAKLEDRILRELDKKQAQLEEKDRQIAKSQKTIDELTATVRQNSETLKIYSVKLLALTEGKTGQIIEDIQEVVGTKEEETDQTPEIVIEVDTDKAPIEEVIEDQTEGTEETQKEVEETAKTGQEETKKKKHFWDFLFEER